MAHVGPRSRVPRGAAAVEFALVAPLFLLLMAGVASFGLGLVTLHRLNGAAATVARSCVAKMDTGDTAGGLQSCAAQGLTDLKTSQRINDYFGCNAEPLLDAQVVDISLAKGKLTTSNQRLVLLTVRLTCQFNVNPLKAFSKGVLPGTLQLNVSSAMPFVLGGR